MNLGHSVEWKRSVLKGHTLTFYLVMWKRPAFSDGRYTSGCQQRKRGREVGCDTRWIAQGSTVGMEVFCHDDNMTEMYTHMLDLHQCPGLTMDSTSVSCNQWRRLGERHMRFL